MKLKKRLGKHQLQKRRERIELRKSKKKEKPLIDMKDLIRALGLGK